MASDTILKPQGTLSLPAGLLKRLALTPGETITLAELGGVEVRLIADTSGTDLALEIERAIEDAGISADELFASLANERERYAREKYGFHE